MSEKNGDIVLFAVVGMSPAVLTETVWALAHEEPPAIPDRVVVLTTSSGKRKIEEQLFAEKSGTKSGWNALISALSKEGLDVTGRLKFGNTGDSIRVFASADGSHDLDDIASSLDNNAAADFMLRHLRGFTANPSTSVIASIAGGRKTMSALMISCMSLLGREQDRVCHVLVNPPFDTPLEPPFLFPVQRLKHIDKKTDKAHSSLSAVIELADVPFVRMLGWYQEKYREFPPSYSSLVAGVQKHVPKVYPVITIDLSTGQVLVDETAIDLASTEFLVFHERCTGNSELLSIGETLKHYKSLHESVLSDFYEKFKESSRFTDDRCLKEDVSRCDSAIRRKLKSALIAPYIDELIPKRGRSMTYPECRIRIKGELPFVAL